MRVTDATEVEALVREIRSQCDIYLTSEPDEVAAIRSGEHQVRAGTGGQYFTTWDTAHGMLRDWACYGLFPLLKLAEGSEAGFTPAQLLELWAATSGKYSAYLGYSGFGRLHEFQRRGYAACAGDPRHPAIVAVLRELVRYANRLTAWSHHYFPWGVGAGLRYAQAPESAGGQGRTGARDVLEGIEGPRVLISWEPLGIQVEAVLAASLNPELVAEFTAALPFTIPQEHALVSGESLFAWSPLVSTAPVRHSERICDAPVGRLRFSQATGQKFIVQYGTTTEDLASPLLGQVVPGHGAALAAVGAAAWRNTLDRREDIWVSLRTA